MFRRRIICVFFLRQESGLGGPHLAPAESHILAAVFDLLWQLCGLQGLLDMRSSICGPHDSFWPRSQLSIEKEWTFYNTRSPDRLKLLVRADALGDTLCSQSGRIKEVECKFSPCAPHLLSDPNLRTGLGCQVRKTGKARSS